MDAIEAIMSRHSIRRYSGETVPDELAEKLLHAAMAAPSARNERPWHFIIVRDRGLLTRVPEVNHHAQMATEAALAIVVCADPKLQNGANDYWVQDCALAGQNILLAAHALGLGAVWTALYPDQGRVEKARELFHIPQGVVPLCLIPVGWPAEKKAHEERYDAKRVHRERW